MQRIGSERGDYRYIIVFVRCDDYYFSAAAQYPMKLSEYAAWIVQMLHHAARDDDVEFLGFKRELVQVATDAVKMLPVTGFKAGFQVNTNHHLGNRGEFAAHFHVSSAAGIDHSLAGPQMPFNRLTIER